MRPEVALFHIAPLSLSKTWVSIALTARIVTEETKVLPRCYCALSLSPMTDDTETMLPRRAGGCEWTMVAARIRSFTRDRSGAVGCLCRDACRVRSCLDIVGGVDIFLWWWWWWWSRRSLLSFELWFPYTEIGADNESHFGTSCWFKTWKFSFQLGLLIPRGRRISSDPPLSFQISKGMMDCPDVKPYTQLINFSVFSKKKTCKLFFILSAYV